MLDCQRTSQTPPASRPALPLGTYMKPSSARTNLREKSLEGSVFGNGRI